MKLNFKYPIEYLKEKHVLPEVLKEDLELLKTHSEDNKPIYNILLKPKTQLGQKSLEKSSKFYTTNVEYLKETQKLTKKAKDIDFDPNLIDNMYNKWNNIKGDEDFVNKYQYIGWDKLKWLNYSQIFLHILSIYNLLSPVINLMSPLFLFIVPFILLRSMRIKITWKMYRSILITQLKSHAIGQLFTSFHKVKMSQKVYIMFCAGMYIYNFYQNILSCYRFYKNAHFITENISSLKTYLRYTIEKMKMYEKMVDKYKQYKNFKKDLIMNRKELENFLKEIQSIPDECKNFKNLFKLGKIMKYFYTIYDNFDLDTIMNYSFEFNGYVDNILGVYESFKDKKINKAKYVNNNTTIRYKKLYHPSIENPVTNDIDFSKNKIITGPNAAGKTTILKATILSTIFSQQFGFGYFKSGKISPFEHFHCYINIPDTSGRDSLFQAEARRCKDILDKVVNNPRDRHLCVFDELYSGTNPYEAISSAFGYIKYITKNKNVKFLLTTHFIRLCNLLDTDKDINNCSMKTVIVNDIPKYYYKIQDGISKVKGGITVLKEIDYPEEILKNSRIILNKLN